MGGDLKLLSPSGSLLASCTFSAPEWCCSRRTQGFIGHCLICFGTADSLRAWFSSGLSSLILMSSLNSGHFLMGCSQGIASCAGGKRELERCNESCVPRFFRTQLPQSAVTALMLMNNLKNKCQYAACSWKGECHSS